MIIGGQLLARFSVSLCNYPLEYPGNISVSLCNYLLEYSPKFFQTYFFSIPPLPPCRYQKWIPEIIYMQKMVSHIQIGLQGAKLEVSVLNMS